MRETSPRSPQDPRARGGEESRPLGGGARPRVTLVYGGGGAKKSSNRAEIFHIKRTVGLTNGSI